MDSLLMLIPVALVLGLIGLGGFLWALRSGQFDDLDGAAHRILFDEDDVPVPPTVSPDDHPAPTPTPTPSADDKGKTP